jgi:aminopeptidase N
LFVDIYVGGKADRKKITVMKADETFEFTVNTKPDLINFDAEKQLLCTKKETKTINEWAFQYKNAPLYLDRYEALSELVTHENDSTSKYVLTCALDDKYYELRTFAIYSLIAFNVSEDNFVKSKMQQMAVNEEKSEVREAAINYLSKITNDKILEEIYKNGLKDKSYRVERTSLNALANVNKDAGMTAAGELENETNNSILTGVLQIYSTKAGDDKNDFFIKAANNYNGYYKINWITNYGTFLKNDKKDETVNSGITYLANIASDTTNIKWVNYYIKKVIREIADVYTEKEKKETTNGNTSAANAAKTEEEKIMEVYNKLK